MEPNAVDLVFRVIISIIGGTSTLIAWFIKRSIDKSMQRIDALEKGQQNMQLEMVNTVNSIEITLTKLNTHVEGFARYDDLINELKEKSNKMDEKINQLHILISQLK